MNVTESTHLALTDQAAGSLVAWVGIGILVLFVVAFAWLRISNKN